MRFRTYEEATAFVKGLMKAKLEGKREFLGVKLDSIPAWTKTPKDPNKPWVPDGAEIEAVYLAYQEPTDDAKKAAEQTKKAGVALERISGRLVDVRVCSDDTVQVLFVTALRKEEEAAFRGPNVDKGILCYLAIGEGLGEPVEDIIARVPQTLKDKLREMKKMSPAARKKARTQREAELKTKLSAAPAEEKEKLQTELKAVEVPAVTRGTSIIDVPSQTDTDTDGESRFKLK